MALIYAQDGQGFIQPLLVDAAGNVLVSAKINSALPAGTNNIGDVDIISAPTLVVQGTNSDKLLSYSDNLLALVGSASLAAGTNTFTIWTVPANFVYHTGTFSVIYTGTITTVTLNLIITRGGTDYYIYSISKPNSAQYYSFVVDVPLKVGDVLKYVVTNATATNSSYCHIVGHSFHTT